MSRSPSWLPSPMTAFCLALSMSLAILWGRSYHVCESYDLDRPGQKLSLASHHGVLCLERLAPAARGARRLTFSRGPGYHASAAPAHPPAPSVEPVWALAGFSVTNGRIESIAVQDVALPYWFLVSITAAAAVASADRSTRRPPMGHCAACSYNLMGNVSGVCPECGTSSRVGHV